MILNPQFKRVFFSVIILKRFIADFKHLYGKLKSTFQREKCKNRGGKKINIKLK